MSRWIVALPLVAVLLVMDGTRASARPRIATSADDICPPKANPCVIHKVIEVDRNSPLDFGQRAVRVTPKGGFSGTLDLRAGSIDATGTDSWMTVGSPSGGIDVRVAVSKACSLNPTIACRSDAFCTPHDAGTCSVGSGDIRLRAPLVAPSSWVELHAAGEVDVMEIDAGGTSSGDSGGFVLITTAGDVLLRRPVSVSNGLDGEDRGYGGRFIIFTDGDLRIDRPIRALHGGSVFLAAGNDLLVNASVLTQGGRSQGVSFQAGRDLVLGKPGGRRLRIDTNAAQRVPCGERFNLSGSLTTLHSGRDTVVGSNVLFTGIGAVGDEECTVLGRPRGGQYTAFARGTFSMAGAIVTEARGPFGVPAPISIRSEDSIDIRPEAVIQASGNYADFISINASRSARISGHVSAVADSAGGSLSFSADKLSIDGTIEGGGDRNGGAAFFSGCDVALQPGATIDLSHGTQGGHQSSVRFKVGGAMSAAPESVVVGNPESKIEVLYSPTSPLPVLDGTIQPTPSLTEDPTIVPCQ